MTETSCAISAAAQFSPAVDFADLDGSLLIANDRFKGMEVVKGKITLPDLPGIYNPQIQISAESETKRSIFREKDKTKRSKKESAQHSKSRNKSFVMTSVSAL